MKTQKMGGGRQLEIILADEAGFCVGVRRAIDQAIAETEKRGTLYSQGPLIHNRQVVDGLRAKGLEPIEDIDDAPQGSAVMLRTHGVGPSVYERAEARGLQVIDATCPFVRRAQQEAARLQQTGKAPDNAVIESFNGRLHDECLNQHWLLSLDEARVVTEAWREDYNPAVRMVLWATGRHRSSRGR